MTDELEATLLALSRNDKWRVIGLLEGDLETEDDAPPTAEEVEELERRAAEFAADPSRGVKLDELFARVRAKNGR